MESVNLNEKLIQPTFSISQRTTSTALRIDKVIKELKKVGPYITLEDSCSEVWACAITSSKDVLYTSSKDLEIKAWNLSTKNIDFTFEGHKNIINCLSLIKKDTILISADWEGIIIAWDIFQKQKIKQYTAHTYGIYCSLVTTDEMFYISGSGDCTVKIWNLEDYNLTASIKCDDCCIRAVALMEKKQRIIAAGSGTSIWCLNIKNFFVFEKIEWEKGHIQCLVVTKNEDYIIIGTRKNTIIIYNFLRKKISSELQSHSNWIRGLALISNDRYLISVSADKTIRIFNFADRKEESLVKASEGYIYAMCISKDENLLVTAGAERSIRLWNIGSSKRYIELGEVKKANQLLAPNINDCYEEKKPVESLTITKNENFLIAGLESETIQIWDISTGLLVKSLEIERKSTVEFTKSDIKKVFSVEITNDDKYLVSISHDGRLTVWDFQKFERIRYLTETANAICPVAVSSDSQYAFSASKDNKICIWDLVNLIEVTQLEGHSDIILNIKVDKEDQIIVSHSTDSKLIIWDLPNRALKQVITMHHLLIRTIALSPDKNFFAIGGPSVILWQWETKSKMKSFTHHKGLVKYVNFSADSNYLVSCAADNTIRIFNVYEEKQELVLNGHTSTIRRVLFLSSGTSIISAGDDSKIRIWDLNTLENELADVGEPIESFCFINKILNKLKPNSEDCGKSFSMLRINLTHIYAYLGYQELLQFALESGAEIKTDADGHSALYYCIQRECQYCVDTIIKYLIELKTLKPEKFVEYSHAFHNEFYQIISNRSIYLPEFLEAIFYTIPDQPNFGVPTHHLPYTFYSDTKALVPSNFIHDPDKLEAYIPEKTLEFRTMPFPIPHITGSKESLALLINICNCTNLKIFETKFIKDFVRKKWDNIWYLILFQTVLMWINVLWMVFTVVQMYTTNIETTNYECYPYLNVFLMINIILAICEIFQLISTGIPYFQSIWNWVDIFRSIYSLLWVVLSYIYPQKYLLFLTWVMAILNLVRGLTSFKAFDSTRFYTRLIFFAIIQSLPFLGIFFYTTFMFGVIYLISKEGHMTDYKNIWINPYNLSMGDLDFDTDISVASYIYFMMATVINVIIMLNLLVSILGDSFDSFQMSSKQIDCLEMAQLIYESENYYIWNREKSDKQYIHLCQEHKEEEDPWEGRIRVMMTMIKGLKLEMNTGMLTINKKMDLILSKLK